MRSRHESLLIGSLFAALVSLLIATGFPNNCAWGSNEPKLWPQAKHQIAVHRFSTLFTAQDVRDHLAKPDGLAWALSWCKRTGVTKVYIEAYRDGYRAERAALKQARDTFHREGFEVAGCVTTTKVGKPSTGWKEMAGCYTDLATQKELQSIFEYAASVFDEIMIDDFWFTDCACPECDQARQSKTVTIGERKFPVDSDAWDDYRSELMVQLSRERVIEPARRVNPTVHLIVKYPQWYDTYHKAGYDIARQTRDFDRIWVGTETRDFGDKQWGGTPQYEAYFVMRWLGDQDRTKCGGGWYDSFGTTKATYIEQARQTILGGAQESLLFSYGTLQSPTGKKDTEALRQNMHELLAVAAEVKKRSIIGVSAYKPVNSEPGKEKRIFDFVGMLGIPLVPCHEFPEDAPAAFFSIHALKDPDFARKLTKFIADNRSVLLTDGLVHALGSQVDCSRPNVQILPVKGDPKALLDASQTDADDWRQHLLQPLSVTFTAPPRVSLYLFGDGSWVIENFSDLPAAVQLNGKSQSIGPRSWRYHWNK